MQVKTYTGESTTALLGAIKADLGADAVILDTKQRKENGKTVVTITAALERNNPEPAHGNDSLFSGLGLSPVGNAYTSPHSSPVAWKAWHEEWSNIKGHLLALMKPELKLETLTPRQRVAVEYLQREGVEDAVILDVYSRLQPAPNATVLSALADLVPVRAWNNHHWPQKVHCISGPFGVGKTTVALRLALWLRKHHDISRICLVNANVERGGGRLLLKNYAELSDMEYREVSTRKDVAGVLAEAANEGFERLIVDLPGLSRTQRMEPLLTELGLDSPAIAMHLVLSPHFDMLQYPKLIERYIPSNATRRDVSLIWTKLDETDRFGAFVNVSAASRLPVSALSFGPSLRNTLQPATDAALWRLLFKHELPDTAPANGSKPLA